MQKIKKGLQEKLNLISKIKNNLKVKKFQIKTTHEKNKIEFPTLQKSQQKQMKQHTSLSPKKQKEIRNPETQLLSWINIKKLHYDKDELIQFLPTYSSQNSNNYFNEKILNTTFTTRLSNKNNLMKIIQFKNDKNNKDLGNEFLRKTFLQKSLRNFSPQKLEKHRLVHKTTEKDETFYGKINQTNHVSGTRFKTLDPRFGGLTREELKQKITRREMNYSNLSTLFQSPRIIEQSRIQPARLSLNSDRERNSSFTRYNLSMDERLSLERRPRRGKQLKSKDRYSPWDQAAEELAWEDLPKIQ